jgi:hypothetical protein
VDKVRLDVVQQTLQDTQKHTSANTHWLQCCQSVRTTTAPP